MKTKKLTEKQKKENINLIAEKLEEIYPAAECALEYEGEPWKLLIMGRLSAQCTDARVNIVCKDLFKEFKTLEDMAEADVAEIAEIVRPCGLFNTKAQNIKDACQMLITKFGGKLPDTMEELLELPGVGRKIANLLLGDIFKKPSVVADTHFIRICGRLGMYDESQKNPNVVEKTMEKLIKSEYQTDFCHRIVLFGREICSARAPKCESCPVAEYCLHNINKGKKS